MPEHIDPTWTAIIVVGGLAALLALAVADDVGRRAWTWLCRRGRRRT